jgi:hypothetical protein
MPFSFIAFDSCIDTRFTTDFTGHSSVPEKILKVMNELLIKSLNVFIYDKILRLAIFGDLNFKKLKIFFDA